MKRAMRVHKMTFDAIYKYYEATHIKTIIVRYNPELSFNNMWAEVLLEALEYGNKEGIALEAIRFVKGEVE